MCDEKMEVEAFAKLLVLWAVFFLNMQFLSRRSSHLASLDMFEEVLLKMDSMGRFCIPAEVREQIGEVVVLKKTPEGYLFVPAKQADFLEEFRRLFTSKHKRTGKPAFPLA
jgi:bifunctional DNA-binding transcriptional regulator/antitoxin component of YhaV-PrlF toxin-antitoxin module